jgi:hypothetical protein
MTILGFRDPHAFAKEQTYLLGLDDQEDQPLYDGIDSLSRDQASYLRLRMLGVTQSGDRVSLTKEKVVELISEARNFRLSEASGAMQ